MLYVEQGFHHDALYSDYLVASDYSFVNEGEINLEQGFECTAKFVIVKRTRKCLCNVKMKIQYALHLINLYAITPGQAVVFYNGEVCLGGATIDDVYKNEGQLSYVV